MVQFPVIAVPSGLVGSPISMAVAKPTLSSFSAASCASRMNAKFEEGKAASYVEAGWGDGGKGIVCQ